MRDGEEMGERSKRKNVRIEEDDFCEGSETEDVEFGEDRSEIGSTCTEEEQESRRSAR